jgi:hypothetical protein
VAIENRPFTLQLLLSEVYADGWDVPIDEKYLKERKYVWEFAITEVPARIGTFAYGAQECWENREILRWMTGMGEMCDSLASTWFAAN